MYGGLSSSGSLLGFLVSGTIQGFGAKASEAEPHLQIIVRVHNYAAVRPWILAKAKKEVTRIFQEVDVEILWAEGLADSRELEKCLAYGPRQPLPHLDLSIVPNSITVLPGFGGGTLGFTSMSREGERVSLADIFYDRVTREADARVQASIPQLLGHAMAHEIGHMLLRTSQHSSAGIMRARWTPGDLHRAEWGQLLFTPEQVALMRMEVLARTGR